MYIDCVRVKYHDQSYWLLIRHDQPGLATGMPQSILLAADMLCAILMAVDIYVRNSYVLINLLICNI